MENAWLSMFLATIAWSPIPGPSCLRTTTYNHHHCSLICRRKLRESQLIPDAWQKVLFQSLQLEQEEGQHYHAVSFPISMHENQGCGFHLQPKSV